MCVCVCVSLARVQVWLLLIDILALCFFVLFYIMPELNVQAKEVYYILCVDISVIKP